MAIKTYWDNYAYIAGGEVKNIVVFEPNGSYTLANQFAHQLYGPESFAVCINDYPVQIGDSYTDGEFYRGIEKIDKVDEMADQLLEIKQALAELGGLITGGTN